MEIDCYCEFGVDISIWALEYSLIILTMDLGRLGENLGDGGVYPPTLHRAYAN